MPFTTSRLARAAARLRACRLARSFPPERRVWLDDAGGISDAPVITPSLVRVRRFTYDRVDELLHGGSSPAATTTGEEEDGGDERAPAVLDALRLLEEVSSTRRRWRTNAGAMVENLPDMDVEVIADAGAPDGVEVRVRGSDRDSGVATRIVTECMLLAGEAAAAYGIANEIPMAFRAQEILQELSDEVGKARARPGERTCLMAFKSTMLTQAQVRA